MAHRVGPQTIDGVRVFENPRATPIILVSRSHKTQKDLIPQQAGGLGESDPHPHPSL